jgi:hypothetical protein
MESQSLRRTRSPPEHFDNNAVSAVPVATYEEEERLEYILHQLNEKQVPPTSHHGLTIVITGANRYVL